MPMANTSRKTRRVYALTVRGGFPSIVRPFSWRPFAYLCKIPTLTVGGSKPTAKVYSKIRDYKLHLYGEVFHRSTNAPLEQAASYHHRASVVA